MLILWDCPQNLFVRMYVGMGFIPQPQIKKRVSRLVNFSPAIPAAKLLNLGTKKCIEICVLAQNTVCDAIEVIPHWSSTTKNRDRLDGGSKQTAGKL